MAIGEVARSLAMAVMPIAFRDRAAPNGISAFRRVTARPEQFNLELAIWTEKASTTKQRKTHRVPLSRTAVAFIRTRLAGLPHDTEWLFPGDVDGNPIEDIRRILRAGQRF